MGGSRDHVVSSGSSVTAAMKLESERVGIALTCHLERNKRKFGNDDRQEWSLIGRKMHRESMTRRCKALFRDCYCRDVMVMSDKDFQFVKDDIKWVKFSLVFVTILKMTRHLKISTN